MSTFDLDSFEELEVTPHEEANEAASKHVVTVLAALAEADEAMAKSVELCKRFDPEDEPYRSKYLAREALKIAIKKLSQHASSTSAASAEEAEACKVMIARLEWRIGAICMDVEETGNAKDFLMRSLAYWRPKVVELIDSIPLDSDGKSVADESETESEAKVVAELLAYCQEQSAAEKKKNADASASAAAAKKPHATTSRSWHWPVEVVEALSHLGIYHHNFEHFKHGLVCLKLSEALIEATGVNVINTDAAAAAAAAAVAGAAAAGGGATPEEGLSPETIEACKACHTHVVFYLAQAYAAVHRPHEAAGYCQLTLQLQLQGADPRVLQGAAPAAGDAGGGGASNEFGGIEQKVAFSPSEWYKNCGGLVEYFISQDQYRDAEHCLAACDVIVERLLAVPTPPATPSAIADAKEKRLEAEADMHRRWGLLYLNILQDAALWRQHHLRNRSEGDEDEEEGDGGAAAAAGGGEKSPKKGSLQSGMFPTLTTAAAASSPGTTSKNKKTAKAGGGEKEELSESDVAALAVDDDRSDSQKQWFNFSKFLSGIKPCTAPLPQQVKTFDAARSLFKMAMARHAKAKEFFVLDGFVTDHVALCKDVSSMYKFLAMFEDDEKRKTIMFGRRTAELLPIIDQLGKNAYSDTLKQLSFECGEIFMEMTEMKQERLAAKRAAGGPNYRPKEAEVVKSNEYCNSSIDAFEKFTNFYRREKPVPLFPMPPERGAESDEESEYDDKETKERKAKRRAAKALEREEERKGGQLTIPDDELGIHLRAHFYIARMLGKLLPLPSDTGDARVRGLRESLQKYEWLAKFAREEIAKLPKKPKPKTILSDPDKPEPWVNPDECFKDELAMCDQMVQLLPQQIARVHYLKQEFK